MRKTLENASDTVGVLDISEDEYDEVTAFALSPEYLQEMLDMIPDVRMQDEVWFRVVEKDGVCKIIFATGERDGELGVGIAECVPIELEEVEDE